jgi:hypothetical protein
MHIEVYLENLKGRDQLGDFDMDARILLKLIFKKQHVGL